ncbi:hypothetical protein IFM89_025869 [Coptis chinensis]|uniref:Uncharacterized protein n=1 Tax=Coptis chinensis TaxID=261450 RepID=A0A835LJG9_9MAGN|nr:hypothetical protein IFM89_025869 [Coptis chinensis]
MESERYQIKREKERELEEQEREGIYSTIALSPFDESHDELCNNTPVVSDVQEVRGEDSIITWSCSAQDYNTLLQQTGGYEDYKLFNSTSPVDGTDLLKLALQPTRVPSGIVKGYSGDAWFPQPAPKDHPWRYMPNQAMTPHISGNY